MTINEKFKMIIEYGEGFIGAYTEDEVNSACVLFIQYHKKLENKFDEIEKGKLYTFLMFQDEVGFNAVYKAINKLSENNLNINWETFCYFIDNMPLRNGYKEVLT